MIEEIKKEINNIDDLNTQEGLISIEQAFEILDKYDKLYSTFGAKEYRDELFAKYNNQPDYKSDLESIIKEVNEFVDFKLKQMDEFNITQRKETGAFWYSTYGEIQGLKDKIQELSKKYGLEE